jgi:hypothetical protein
VSRSWLLVGGVQIVLAALVVAWEPWHGPILFSLVSGRGIDAGDLIVLPLLVGAMMAFAAGIRDRSRRTGTEIHEDSARPAIAAMALGSLLLIAQLLRAADLDDRIALLAYSIAGLIMAAAFWVSVEILLTDLPPALGNQVRFRIVGGLLVVGLAADVLLAQFGGTTLGIALATGYLAFSTNKRWVQALLATVALCCVVATVMSLADIAGVDVLMSKDGGGAARSISLGIVLVLAGGAAATAARPRQLQSRCQ